MSDYASVVDIQKLKRNLSMEEQERAKALIPIICSIIRFEAKKTGRDYDEMIYKSELVSIIDSFDGDGSKTFELSYVPQSDVKVSVHDIAYSVSGKELTFEEAPEGVFFVAYTYRALAEVAKSVVCDVVMRELNTPGTQLPATSYSESAGGVSQSFTLPNASGAIKLWPSDLKALGLKRQQISALNLGNPCRR